MKVSDYIVKFLVRNGYDTFFLVTGGAIVPMVDAIGRNPKAKMYCFQHEQSAAMAAEAHYRTKGKIGVVLSTSGPGAQNLLNGICGCYYESIPCVFITGQVNTNESLDQLIYGPRQIGFQETPVVDSFKHFTQYCVKLDNISLIKKHLNNGFSSLHVKRKGPILFDIPVNIQNSEIDDVNKWDEIRFPIIKRVGSSPIINEIVTLNDKLKTSKTPLLLIGHGVRLAGAMERIKKLVDVLNIPFVVSWGGVDILPHDHPLFVGTIGVYGSRGGNMAIQNCDLLISIGSRLDTRQTGGNLKTFARDAYKVVVDVDKTEFLKFTPERGLKIDLPIVEDASLFIKDWLRFGIDNPKRIYRPLKDDWWFQCRRFSDLNILEKLNRPKKDDVLSSYEFLEQLNKQLPEKCTIIPDEGGHLVWAMQSLTPKEGQRLFTNFGNSSMGYGLPAAIGAAIENDEPVILIDGDGGFQMNIQELQTIVHYNLPVKIFIMNNNCYGIIKQFQDAYFESRYTATEKEDYSAPNFVKVAQAYGINGVTIHKNSNIDFMIDQVLNYDGPVLVNVEIDREQKLLPKLEFGNPLEDMYPYMEDKELDSYMLIEQLPRRDNTQGWVDLENEKTQKNTSDSKRD